MERAAGTGIILCVLTILLCAGQGYAQTGVFDRPGIISGHGAYSSLPEESVDLFTGNLTLRYRDIFIPGPNGLNIEVWRVYNSKVLYDRPVSQPNPTVQAYPKSMLGIGWTMHMGMVRNAFSSTPEIVFPDGRREISFPPKSEYGWGSNYRITRDFLKYYCQTGYYPKLYFQNGVVWTFGNIASLPLANGSTETVYMVTRIEDPLGNFIDIEYDAADSLRSISKITDSMGREVRFIKSYQGSSPAKLAEIWTRNADDTEDVIYGYSVGSFPNGFYKLTSFTPPVLPTSTTYEYNDGSAYNYELTRVTTSFGGVLEYSYNSQSFYFNTTQLISKVASQKRITFDAGEQAKVWDYVYPTYQGVSSGTTTVTGPEYSASATHYGYESTSANRWRIGLQTANATGDGSGSTTTAWTYHEISTTSWYVLGVNMGTAKGPILSSVVEDRKGDSELKREYYYLRGGQTTVKRYGLPTKITFFVNGSPTAKYSKELMYFFENVAHSGFKDRYMLAFVENERDKTPDGEVLKETITSYFEEDGKWGALKQVKRWKTGTTYLTWDYTYTSVSPERYSVGVDGPGETGLSGVSYHYGLEQEATAPDYLKYTRLIKKYGFVQHEWNQYGGERFYEYDELGRMTKVDWKTADDPPQLILTTSYDWRDGENKVVITQGENTITRSWDGFGRDLGSTETGDETTLYYLKELDAEGRIKRETNGSVSEGHKYSYSYDAAGRVTQVTDPVSETTTIQYSANRTKTVTDPEIHSTVYAYNDLPGLPTQVTDAQGHVANCTYDALGRLITVVYNAARTQSYAYDPLDHMTSEIHPETGLISYTYDASNRLSAKSWGGAARNFIYNASGQLLSTTGDESVTYEYNDKGAVVSVTGSTGWSRSGITYDDFGHVTAETVTIPGLGSKNLAYAYDDNGNLTETTYPDGNKAIQTFNSLGRPETLKFGQGETPPAIIDEASYGPNKMPAMMKFKDNILLENTTFFANGVPNTVSLMGGSTPLYNATYGYDGAGNITSISSTAPAPALNATFGYDSLNRLTSASYSTGAVGTYSYEYDAHGNMLTVRHDGNVAFSKTYDASNRIVGYQYDARGNLISANGKNYAWDSDNRLKAVTDALGQYVGEYSYDGQGRRIASFPPRPDINIAGYPPNANADLTTSLQTPGYKTFTIYNAGYGSLNLGNLEITGQDSSLFTVYDAPETPVLPFQSTEFTIRFLPSTTGDKQATLSITSNDPDQNENPYFINLRGFCEPEIEIGGVPNGGTFDFGDVIIGQSASETLYVHNDGTATLVLYGWPIEIEQPGGQSDFILEDYSVSSEIGINNSNSFTVRFAPTAEGLRTATVTISSNDLDEDPYTITLAGTGLNGPEKITDGSELTLLAPNGGEKLEAGALRPIIWSGGERVKAVKLEYSTDNGTTYRTIVERFADVGTYPWQVPDEISGSCLVRINDADGTPTSPVIVSFEFNFRVSAAGEAPQDRPHFVFRAGLPDPKTLTFQVAEVAFAPDGVRGSENLLFNHALGEIQPRERFLGRWHRARITYDLGTYTGSVWIDNEPILSGVPLQTDLDIQRPAEIALELGQEVPVKLWVDDIDVRFVDQSSVGQDPERVALRPLMGDNFNRYESALFPREGGWLSGLERARRQGEIAEEGAEMLRAAQTEEAAQSSGIDDQAFASSARSFKLDGTEEEPGVATKRFSLPERIPYCVSAENFSIVATEGGVQTGGIDRDSAVREEIKDEKRQRRGDRRTPESGRDRTTDKSQSERLPRADSIRRGVPKDSGDAKMLSGPLPSGTYYIYSFDGRLLAEYGLGVDNLVRDYIYFGGQLVAEYKTGALYYYASDQINSTRIVTDSTGAVVYSAAHEPYGGIQETWVSTNFDPELKFSGKPRDVESELDYFGARYYDRSQYRLLSPNSISAGSGFAPASHSWNAYSYPANHLWAETYVLSGWMVSAMNTEVIIRYPPPKLEPEIPWWTVSYPWLLRPDDTLWFRIKSSGEKRVNPPDWIAFDRHLDNAERATNQKYFDKEINAAKSVWKNYVVKNYEYGADPFLDAILANYGMSMDPLNPLSYWNLSYILFYLEIEFQQFDQ